ncbi:MAG: crotonase/enoyl-CoA hydratase family protein [Alphaproteobacteria bacterium]|nr:crotonase/enoyl-CoA hydratase family protein [Alphaproteobacteria bacterium]
MRPVKLGPAIQPGRPAVSYSTFDFSVADDVAHVRLNRPGELNTMTMPFWQEIADVFTAIDRDGAARVAVISSTGRHFTAGLDLKAFGGAIFTDQDQDRGRLGERMRRTVLEMQESFNAIERCRVPVLAAIQGGCIGGGVDMISACDMRYCSADAWFCIQEINIGMTADVGTLQRLPHLMPSGLVRELAYSGRRLPAERAKSCGLVNEVYADQATMLEAVMALAREIASKSPLAVSGTKEMLNYTRDHSVADALNHIATWQAGMFFTEDLMEQMQANLEKRPARFKPLLPSTGYVRRRG